jgi:hypothetical protein
MAQPQSFTRGPVRLEARVSGNAIDYEVRVDQARRAGRPLPSMAQPAAGQGWSWKLIAGLAAMAVVVALGVFLIVNILLAQRRPYGREGKP